MKKNIVLFVLFVLPIVAYLFFASGVNNFSKLPTVTPNVPDLPAWKGLDGETVSLQGKITILGFGGGDLMKNRGNVYNLVQRIYDRYHKFNDLQFVYLCPVGTEKDAEFIRTQFKVLADTKNFHFIFTTPEEITSYYDGLKLKGELNPDAGTPNVYIIDKQKNLRGRKGDDEYKEGYNTFHQSELSNKMLDDFKVILYEYKAALKKNRNATKSVLKHEE